MTRQTTAALITLTILTACSITRRNTLLSKTTPKDTKDRTEISVFALKTTPPDRPNRSIFDLGDRAQAAALTKVSALKDARLDLSPKIDKPQNINLSQFKRRLVVNLVHNKLDNKEWHAADRIIWSDINIEIDNSSDFEFIGYTQYSTGYETVDLGTISRSTNWGVTGSRSTSAEIGISEMVSLSSESSLEGTVGQTYSEEVGLRQRIVVQAISASPKGIRIVREGTSGIDLTGTTYVDVEFRAKLDKTATYATFSITPKPPKTPPPSTNNVPTTPTPPASGCEPTLTVSESTITLTSGDESPQPPTSASASPAPVKSPVKVDNPDKSNNATKILLNTTGTSVIRSVDRRSHTIRESDDKISILKDTAVAVPLEIDLQPVSLYRIKYLDDNVSLRSPAAHKPLVFSSLSDVTEFFRWLSVPGNDFEKATCGLTLAKADGTTIANFSPQDLFFEPFIAGRKG